MGLSVAGGRRLRSYRRALLFSPRRRDAGITNPQNPRRQSVWRSEQRQSSCFYYLNTLVRGLQSVCRCDSTGILISSPVLCSGMKTCTCLSNDKCLPVVKHQHETFLLLRFSKLEEPGQRFWKFYQNAARTMASELSLSQEIRFLNEI